MASLGTFSSANAQTLQPPAANTTQTAADGATPRAAKGDPRSLTALGFTLLVGLLLTIVFLAGSFIFVRTSRRARSALFRRRPPPTQSGDVWSTHKLPPDDAADDPRPKDSSP